MTNNMQIELKPCPFCGGEAAIDKNEWIGEEFDKHVEHSAYCTGCGIMYAPVRLHDTAVNSWNKRIEISGQPDELCQEAFETWYLQQNPGEEIHLEKHTSGKYKTWGTECMWIGWQGRGVPKRGSSQPVEWPRAIYDIVLHYCGPFYTGDDVYRLSREDVKNITKDISGLIKRELIPRIRRCPSNLCDVPFEGDGICKCRGCLYNTHIEGGS